MKKPVRYALYAGTRNIYHDMVVAAKSLLYNRGADKVIFLTEDDTFPEILPPCITTINVSNQTYFTPDGPNFNCMWTYMVMMRTALTKILPDIDKILVLDHDTIVNKSIDTLWDIDISDYYYAAVEEGHIRNRAHPYVNFGVCMHNLAKLRDGTDDKIINDVNTVHHLYCEQDSVNDICKGQIYLLPTQYNVMWFNTPVVPGNEARITHHAARRQPLNSFTDYQYYESMTWDQILYDQHDYIPVPGAAKRYDIINHFIRTRNYRTFLEIGTAHGETYQNVIAPIRISVDPDPESAATFRMTSDEFFNLARDYDELGMTFDIIFIDGLHECNQAYRDIRNALALLNPDGVIVMHDCLPTSEAMQQHSSTYPGGLWTGDVWKAFVKARSDLSCLMYTIDTDFGCGIIDTKYRIDFGITEYKQYLKYQNLPFDMDSMTYEQFVANRNSWMNVKRGIMNEQQ